MLTRQEELALILRAKAGDVSAMDVLLRRFDPLLHSIARTYAGGYADDDLKQEAGIALMKAVEKFDPSRGARLATATESWAQHYVGQLARRRPYAVSVPRQFRPGRPAAAEIAALKRGGVNSDDVVLVSEAPMPDAGMGTRCANQALDLLFVALTPREVDIVRHRMAGLEHVEVAARVGIKKSLAQKLEAKAISKMAARARELNLRIEDCLL